MARYARVRNRPLAGGQSTSLVGRAAELAAVTERLLRKDVRLITLTGPAGVGKTRLALAVMNEVRPAFAQVIFIDLAPLSSSGQALPTVARSCGVLEGLPGPLPQRLAQAIGTRRLLLVLDNCEHVLEAMPELSVLLGTCPNLKILATSREALRLRWEWSFPVPPLQVPELKTLPDLDALAHVASVALFVQRAQAVDAGFALLPENARPVAELCIRLDGLPLAIELAATQAGALGPKTILERLSTRLTLADGGARDTPVRHRTLGAAIAWSYGLLTPKEKDLFRRLSVFSGSWTLRAATEICAGDGLDAKEVPPLLEHLVNSSLVVAERQPDDVLRYRFLETIHDYAREQLREAGGEQAIQRRRRDWFLAWAEQGEPNAWGPGMPDWLEEIDADYNNFWAALEWSRDTPGEAAAGLQLWAALARFFDLRGHITDGLPMAHELMRLAPERTPARAMTLLQVSTLTRNQGELERSRLLAEECLAIANELGEILYAAGALMTLGSLAQITGDAQRAETLFQQAVALARSHEEQEPRALYVGLYWLAVYYAMSGSNDRAVVAAEEALALARRQGDVSFIGTSLAVLGRALVGKGDIARAIPVLDKGIRVSQTLEYYELTAYLLDFLGRAAWARRESARAVRLYSAAAGLRTRIGVITWLPDPDYPTIVAEIGEDAIRAAQATIQDLSPEDTVDWALGRLRLRPRPQVKDSDAADAPLVRALTSREMEVAELITEGLNNRQIAAKLFVSRRTVDAHIRNILGKLDLTARTQISAWFTRRRRDST
jgi:predicted ATPase/DNA-binding CsgD family transcriptional regulator